MKFLKIFVPIVLLLGLVWPMALLAQDSSTDLTLEQALANVRAVYGNVLIIEIDFDEDGESQREESCWKFHFVNGIEICVIASSGEIIVDDNSTPDVVVTEDADEPNIVVTEDLDDDFCVDNDGDSGRGDNDDDDCDDFTGLVPVVTLESAIFIARSVNPSVRISSVELELLDDGRLIWEIDFDGANNDVDVDATNGQIVDISGDNDNNNDGDSGRGDDDNNDGDSGRGDDNSGNSDDDNSGNGIGDDNGSSGGSGDDGDSGRGGSGGSGRGGSGGSD